MEFSLIDRIRERTAQGRDDVRLGIGDDAALVSVPAGQELAVAIDTMVEGVHFPRDTRAADIGWKSLAVNLSDLAAMGATPAWALLAMTLPKADPDFIDDFATGFAQLAQSYRLALVGGDTTRGVLTISVAVHGFVPPGKALLRDGAKPGDAIFVTGTLGDAAGGGIVLWIHRHVLRFRLGPPSSADHVIGWPIVRSDPDEIVLTTSGPLMRGELTLRRLDGRRATLTTRLHYRHKIAARTVWVMVGPLHRVVAPRLMERATRPAERAAADAP